VFILQDLRAEVPVVLEPRGIVLQKENIVSAVRSVNLFFFAKGEFKRRIRRKRQEENR
jgi:hypothetical protein